MEERHHLVDFRFHVDGLIGPPAPGILYDPDDKDCDPLAVRKSWSTTDTEWFSWNPNRHLELRTYDYAYRPRCTKALERDIRLNGSFQRNWRWDCEANDEAKARRKWIYGNIGPLKGDDFDFDDELELDSELDSGTDDSDSDSDEEEEEYSDEDEW